MKKIHIRSLKFHTIYSIILALVFVVFILFIRDAALGIAMFILVLYVAGNGIIHTKKNVLTRDAIIEYIVVSAIVAIIIVGAIV